MPRKPKVSWHPHNAAWHSASGDVSPTNGRRKAVYFRGLPKTADGRRQAQAQLEQYIADRDARARLGGDFTFAELARAYLIASLEAAAARHFRDEKRAAPADLPAWVRSAEGAAWRRENATYIGHRAAIRKVDAFETGAGPWGARAARSLTAADLGRMVDAFARAGHKATYIARLVGTVQAVMNWAATPQRDREPERLLESNPLRGFAHEATRAAKEEDRFADAEEVDAFLAWGYAHADARGGLIGRFDRLTVDLVAVAAQTGSRPGELRRARWAHFEPAVTEVAGETWGRITLPPHRWKSGRKTGRAREVYLPPESVAIVEAIRALPGRHPDYIWTNRRGPRAREQGLSTAEHGVPWSVNSLCRRIATLRGRAIADGVKVAASGVNRFTMYRLRHTAAARLLMAGVPVATVARLLGTSVAMVERVYGSFLGRHLAEAAALAFAPRPAPPPPGE